MYGAGEGEDAYRVFLTTEEMSSKFLVWVVALNWLPQYLYLKNFSFKTYSLSTEHIGDQGQKFSLDYSCFYGLPRWLSGKESACQFRRRRIDSWVGKMPWRRKWQPTAVFLPGEYRGQGSLAGCSP